MDTDFQIKPAQERSKRRLERALIVLLVLTVIGLTVLQTYVVRLGGGSRLADSILVFALINVNIILLFFLLFLILRNLYKLFFERQRRVVGASLRTKLVVAFIPVKGCQALPV